MASIDTIRFGSRPLKLGDQAYNLIKEDIIICRLRPGSEMTESGLAEHYRMGLAPIRAALSRLCQEKLLLAIPRRGYVVTPITSQSITDLFDLRKLIEPAAARAAAGHVNGDLLRKLGTGPASNPSGPADRQFLKNNRDFHVEIVRASGNERMTRILESLLDEMERLLHLGLFARHDRDGINFDHEQQRQQHIALIEALVLGDKKAAEKAARIHVEHSRALVLSAMMNGTLVVNL